MLTREQLVKPKTKVITIEDGEVVIRKLTADEAYTLRGKEVKRDEIFGLIATSLVDPALTVEDIGMLQASTVTELTAAIFEFNALGPKAIKEAQAELKKTEADGETSK